jgi:Na+-translocating ferredoxin:NAD+ oxidoreductase RnfG subunit
MVASAIRVAVFAIICSMANAFVVVAPTTTIMTHNQQQSLVTMYGYVPDGLTAEQWKKIKAQEAEKKANLGKVGPRYVNFLLSVVL